MDIGVRDQEIDGRICSVFRLMQDENSELTIGFAGVVLLRVSVEQFVSKSVSLPSMPVCG